MKRSVFYLLIMLFTGGYSQGQNQTLPVFTNGEEGYACYRIPAIIKNFNGDLLAFAEARKKDCDDFGDIDIVMKKSMNNGKAWSTLVIVVDNGLFKAGNPAPVADNQDPRFPKGRLFLLYNTATGSEANSRQGQSIREISFITSTDNGKSWSDPVNITTSVHKPLATWHNVAYNFKEDWRTNALTPGHALQLRIGKNKGRIFVAANHSVGAKKDNGDFDNYRSHCFYSDDHGASWQLGADVPIPGGNESTAAELSDGTVLQNIRYQNKNAKSRILAYSRNAGLSWDTAYVEYRLPDPICEGSMIDLNYKGKHYLLFSNPSAKPARENMTIHVSNDDGRSWYRAILVQPGPSAYSDLVDIDKRNIGILYEKGNEGGIVFKNMPVDDVLKAVRNK
jgi:sialidase-1